VDVVAGVVVDISMSLDGFVAGPNDGLGRGLGQGGEPIHNWVMGGPWTYEGGTPFQASGVDREVIDEMFSDAGAVIVGRRMYDVVDGWGDESPFDLPVFVLTSRPHPPRTVGSTSYTFVTDGIHSALRQARDAAGGKPVSVGGGARVVQQFLAERLVDEMQIHIAPVLLGDGKRLFEHLGGALPHLDQLRVRESPHATHIRYRLTWV
jgi:dihydrofolate reductase